MTPTRRMSDRLARRLAEKVFAVDPEYLLQRDMQAHLGPEATANFLLLSDADAPDPVRVFDRMRWGGLMVFAAYDPSRVRREADRFSQHGFAIEQLARRISVPHGPIGLPLRRRAAWYFVARKVRLVLPGDSTERFTYDVFLRRSPDSNNRYVVVKRVPTINDLIQRLRHRLNSDDQAQLHRQARKLIDHVFPVFLTREAAFLKILARHLPARMQNRVPQLISMNKDERGLATCIEMTWLRRATAAIRQIDFAISAAELLARIHDKARIIHLDLRLDNVIVTPQGVGFVDFGSAARVGENLADNPMLGDLFGQILRTSQIQAMLGRMQSLGLVTSETLTRSHRKIDKAADLFYLALQMTKPYSHPEIRELVRYDADSDEARRIARLTRHVLRPDDPAHAQFKTAGALLGELKKIKKKID